MGSRKAIIVGGGIKQRSWQGALRGSKNCKYRSH